MVAGVGSGSQQVVEVNGAGNVAHVVEPLGLNRWGALAKRLEGDTVNTCTSRKLRILDEITMVVLFLMC